MPLCIKPPPREGIRGDKPSLLGLPAVLQGTARAGRGYSSQHPLSEAAEPCQLGAEMLPPARDAGRGPPLPVEVVGAHLLLVGNAGGVSGLESVR